MQQQQAVGADAAEVPMPWSSRMRRATPLVTEPRKPKRLVVAALMGVVACVSRGGFAAAAPPPAVVVPAARDGSHDFDFEIGEWTTHLKRLQHPLSGSTQWLEYDGTSLVTSLLDGRVNVVELSVQGTAGRIEGVSLRLYEPQSHQWTLNFANVVDGHLAAPMIGEFRDSRGQFYGQDSFKGRSVLVRFTISCVSADSCRFEQAFSSDGAQTWETNWIATDTRRRR